MVHNSPEQPALVSIDAASGATKLMGPALNPLAATGDLAVVDSKRGVLWYLGDTSALGTTLAGVSLANGRLVCQQVRCTHVRPHSTIPMLALTHTHIET